MSETDGAPTPPPGPGATLAEKIEYLRRATAEDPAKPPSFEQMTAEMNIEAGHRAISTPYTWQLTTGRADNPTLKHLALLANHFGVDPAYFVNRDPEAMRAVAHAANDDSASPLRKLLDIFADYFGVDVAYFFDDEAAARIDEELRFLDAIARGDVRSIAMRSAGLSPEALAEINRQIDAARVEEGLDVPDT